MDSHAATWWGRAARALHPVVERLAKLVRGPGKREKVKVRIRREGSRLKSQRSRWCSKALLLLLATGCGGPNNSAPDNGDNTDSGATDPEITSISPTSGPAAGGTLVLITGVGFDPEGTDVLFGSESPVEPPVVSECVITCISPSGTAGESVVVSVVMPTVTLIAPESFN